MNILLNFLPIITFVLIFFGSGIYFSLHNIEDAFYQVPATAAILPSLILAWIIHKGDTKRTMNDFLDGARHPDIITMCMIFVLAGALSSVTSSIGSVESTVNFTLANIPQSYLLIGVFITSALISTAIGTSMGTIAALASLVYKISMSGAFSPAIGAATLVGGAMFGDNMSIISDTTIAAVSSQNANLKEKLKLNVKIAMVASIVTIIILSFNKSEYVDIESYDYNFVLILPFIFLILIAVSGVNVFITLITSLIFAGLIGIIYSDYSLVKFAKDISLGFSNMNEIMLLSILIGGLSGLSNQNSEQLASAIAKFLPLNAGRKYAQIAIAFIVSIFDILLANNVVAIIFSGDMVKTLAKKYNILPHEAATWVDVFSCIWQGIIPYGAQILLVSTIFNLSPFDVITKVYYCFILAGVSLLYIIIKK